MYRRARSLYNFNHRFCLDLSWLKKFHNSKCALLHGIAPTVLDHEAGFQLQLSDVCEGLKGICSLYKSVQVTILVNPGHLDLYGF